MDNSAGATENSRLPIRGILFDIALNAIVPLILYRLSKRFISPSELTALAVAAVFPISKSIFDLLRHRQFDPVSLVVLLGIVTSSIALLFGGSPQILLVRESLFTGAFGVACFVSLLLPRPVMFYFGRHFVAGDDARKRERFNESWELPQVRFANRLITIVWGAVYVAELFVRVILIYTLSAQQVLVLTPLLIGGFTIFTILWTSNYVRRIRVRVQESRLLSRDDLARRETRCCKTKWRMSLGGMERNRSQNPDPPKNGESTTRKN